MRIEDFEGLIEKLEKAKEEKIRLESSLDHLFSQLKSDYGVSTLEEAQKFLERLEEEIESDEKKFKEYLSEIEGITDWNTL